MAFVSIEQPEVDLAERATERTLLQFRKSTTFLNVLQSFILEVLALQDALLLLIKDRGPADASGDNLDAIGRIVGQDRTIFNYTALTWFTPDVVGYEADLSPAWVTGIPQSGSYIVDDKWFRDLILARVLRNFSYYGSIPEIQAVILQALGVTVSFYCVGPMEVIMLAPPTMPRWVLNFMLRIATNKYVDGITFAPFPATLNISRVLYCPTGSFTADSETYCADVGVAAVGQNVVLGQILQ